MSNLKCDICKNQCEGRSKRRKRHKECQKKVTNYLHYLRNQWKNPTCKFLQSPNSCILNHGNERIKNGKCCHKPRDKCQNFKPLDAETYFQNIEDNKEYILGVENK